MKKAILASVVMGALLIGLLCGCTPNAYRVPDENCIVSVPENFLLAAQIGSQASCEKIETPIKGVTTKKGRDYYSVTKDAPLEIVRDYSWFDYEGKNQLGRGKVVSGYQIGEEQIKFKLYDVDFTITCHENCNIEPIYETFTSVGLLYIALSADETMSTEYLYEAKNFFNDDGSIKQIENLYYIYLNGEFTTNQNCWNTNLTVKNFEVTFSENNRITASFTADKISDKLAACSVCRYESGGYFISSVTEGTILGTTMDVGNNALSLQFE